MLPVQACLGRVTIARQLAGAFTHSWSGAVHLHGSSHILLLGSSRVVFTIGFGWLVLAHSNRSSLRSGTCAASVASLSLARMRLVPVRGTATDLPPRDAGSLGSERVRGPQRLARTETEHLHSQWPPSSG